LILTILNIPRINFLKLNSCLTNIIIRLVPDHGASNVHFISYVQKISTTTNQKNELVMSKGGIMIRSNYSHNLFFIYHAKQNDFFYLAFENLITALELKTIRNNRRRKPLNMKDRLVYFLHYPIPA